MSARVPGCLGSGKKSGQCIPNRGRLDGTLVAKGTDDVAPVTPGSMGINDQAAAVAGARPEAKSTESKDAENTLSALAKVELDLLRRLYGTMKNKSNSMSYFYKDKKDKVWVYRTKEYIKDRKSFFGATKDYEDYKKKAKEDLDADREKLRKFVDPPPGVRKVHSDWKDGQDVFYAWVKKAYEKEFGTKTEYSKVIKAQKSDKLQKALAKVKKDYTKRFDTQGMNPRPVKRPGGVYLLGTLSDHAVGSAIDIEPKTNAQIKPWRWKRILDYTGKKVSLSDLARKWKTKDAQKAKEVYDAIKGVSDEWKSELDKAVRKLEEEVEGSAGVDWHPPMREGPTLPMRPGWALDAVIASDANLKKINSGDWVKKWRGGFLSLEWALVKELHEEGFKWGATFDTPDLHHFEL